MKKYLLISVFVLFFVTGCFDRREITQLAIINSMLFDYKDGKFKITIEIVNTRIQGMKSGGATTESPYLYTYGEGDSIISALYNNDLSFNQDIYSAHIKAVFLTESFVRNKGFKKVLESYTRYPDTRETPFIFVVKGENAGDLYKSHTSSSEFFGDYVMDSYKTNLVRLESGLYVEILKLINDYTREGIASTLGVIEKIKMRNDNSINPLINYFSKDDTEVRISGMAVFKKDKLAAFLDKNETKMYNTIMGKAKTVDIDIEESSYRIAKIIPKVDVKYKNKQIYIDINLDVALTVTSNGNDKPLDSLKTIKNIQKKVDQKLEEDAKKLFDKAQNDIGLDFFGFGTKFYIKYPKEWDKIEKAGGWNKYFSKAKIDIKVNTSLVGEGKIVNSFKERTD